MIRALHSRLSVVAAIFLATGSGARAADASGDQVGPMFDIAFGITATSDYMWRGITQTNGPAVQPWAEFGYGMFYAGYWGSNTGLSLVGGNWEHDLSIGVRPELGPVSIDFGYVRYLYDTGDCCGEAYLKGSFSPVDRFTLGVAVFWNPANGDVYGEGSGSFDLPHDLALSGAAGVQAYGDGSPSVFSWNAGGSWAPLDWLSVDARYHGGPDARVVVSLSLKTSLAAIRGN